MVLRNYWRFHLAILLLVQVLQGAHADSLKPEAEFLTRGEMAPFNSVEELLSQPTTIQYQIDSWHQDGWKVIRSESDMHVIYPHPVSYFLDELLDFENTKNNFPRVVESRVEYASDDPFGLHTLFAHISIKVLGFGADYTYVTNNWTEPHDGGYLQRFNLNRCPDGTLYELIGSWYVQEIEYEGKPCTYMRNYTVIGIRKGNLPTEIAMRAFGAWQLRKVFDNINAAVEKRMSGE